MFGILKNLFRKETVKEDELEFWLENKIKTLKQELQGQLSTANERIRIAIGQTKEKLQALEQAGLINPNIPERAKHFMKGNREEYTRRINNFLQSISVTNDIEQFDQFQSKTHEALQELVKGIQRPQTILNEFLAHETKETNAAISSIENEIALFSQKIKQSNYFEFLKVKNSINEAVEAQERLKVIGKQVEEIEQIIKESEDENRKLQEEVQLLKKSKKLTDLKEKQQALAEQKKLLENSLRQKFSNIETALKKYSHITVNNKRQCEEYLSDPVTALTKDLHLSILNLFYDVKKAVERDVLNLKDKKKEKTLEEINAIDKEYLGSFLTEYGRITKDQKQAAKDIEDLDVITIMKLKNDKIIQNTETIIERQAALKKILKEKQKLDVKDPKKELKKLEKLGSFKIV